MKYIRIRRESLEPDGILIRDRMRAEINEEAVSRLMASIKEIGLQTPPTVRWMGDEPVLIAGRHRVEACKRLGIPFIDCIVHEGDERTSRMWEIAENLHRADLTALERSEHIAEWVRLAEDKPAQVAPVSKGGRGNTGGINAATRDLGIDRTDAQRSIKVAGLAPEAKQAAREAGIDDNQAALLRVAQGPSPAAQLAAIRQERDTAEAHKRNRETDRAIALTEAQQFGEWLLARTDLNELPVIISWLEGTKAKDVIAALRREAA
jgi:ParB family transcriptional regulator, chromosome partitioning protein